MTPLRMLEISEKSAHCMRTAIDRFDWQFNDEWNNGYARVWYQDGTIIDIKEIISVMDEDYDVILLDKNYNVIDTYTSNEWSEHMYHEDLGHSEIEDEIYFDSMEDIL